ncbi:MAG TPA: hypothetical protein ENH23_04835 [candidate division Zixibacteria bacterium]|nr:hypothetical protein [candidate division Zixibacteria bacterium]
MLEEQAAAACGQFIGPRIRSSVILQRGIHGTAAALRVVASEHTIRKDANELVPKLVNYLSNRESLENNLPDRSGTRPEKVGRDDNNVVKVSECLISLSYVNHSFDIDIIPLKERYIDFLENTLVENSGWPYFSGFNDDITSIDIVPTAFAIMALSLNKKDASEQADYLRRMVNEGISDPNTNLSKLVLAVYSLVFSDDSYYSQHRRELNNLAVSLYKRLSALLDYDIEQNIEYYNSDGTKTSYIRIPWQLYLIAIINKVDFYRWSSLAIQSRIKHIVENTISSNGFIYKSSGDYVASRTNAILYEVLNRIDNNDKSFMFLIQPLHWLDVVRRFLQSKWIRIPSFLASSIFICYILWPYFTQPIDTTPLGANLVVSILLLLLSFGKPR